jgi:hypothetical protein
MKTTKKQIDNAELHRADPALINGKTIKVTKEEE